MTVESLLVVLCTYNERENIESLLPEIWRVVPQAHILVVDDNSPDGTGTVVAEWMTREPRLRLLSRPGKLGLGTATLAALQFAVDHNYAWVANLDADFSHPPEILAAMLSQTPNHDVVLASRYVPGGGVDGWPWYRHIMSWAINFYARLLLRLPVRDCSGSFRVYRVALLQRIDLRRFLSRGYSVLEELLYQLRRQGARFCEVPYRYAERRHGQSKIRLTEGLRAGVIILRLALGWGR
ncbi:MAG: polyprenol monophosphomannose synthase [Planctomycetaceae bacterium]